MSPEGWLRATLVFEKSGVPPRGSILETVMMRVQEEKKYAEMAFLSTITSAILAPHTQDKSISTMVKGMKAHQYCLFPYAKIEDEEREQAVVSHANALVALGEIHVRPAQHAKWAANAPDKLKTVVQGAPNATNNFNPFSSSDRPRRGGSDIPDGGGGPLRKTVDTSEQKPVSASLDDMFSKLGLGELLAGEFKPTFTKDNSASFGEQPDAGDVTEGRPGSGTDESTT